MITVNVWLPRKTETGKNVGHASLEVAGRAYISWWPDEAAGLGSNHYPLRNKSFASDIRDEGVQADWRIRLAGLDENRVVEWWSRFGLVQNGQILSGPLPRYNLLEQNCCSVVTTALRDKGRSAFQMPRTKFRVAKCGFNGTLCR